MESKLVAGFVLSALLFAGCALSDFPSPTPLNSPSQVIIKLPEPRLKGETSLEEALSERRSIREYANSPLTLGEVAQLLWAGQGKTAEWGGRTAPSAGALYPLEIYLAAGNVEKLAQGVYRYRSDFHDLIRVKAQDVRAELAEAAVEQDFVRVAAIDIVITAVYERTTGKYGDRGVRYAQIEAGHAAQNICLEATVLDLGAVTVGAFFDESVIKIMGAPPNETPLYIIPVGKKK